MVVGRSSDLFHS